MLLDQGLQNDTGHEQGGAARVYAIVRDATGMLALVLITGLLRLILGAKGAAFDLSNPLFHVKLTGFAVMVLLAIPVARQLRIWQTAALADPAFVPNEADLRRLRRIPMLAMHLLVILPVLAALVARGHGLR
ncbi:MAG TPA: DUF2214 family protein [Candidatus Acidoferrales bacterium]|nr:DUF2214 family protein [Candidatus Acidoferrales bacterium]